MKARWVLLLFLILLVAACAIFTLPMSECNVEELVEKELALPPNWARKWIVMPPALPLEDAEEGINVMFERSDSIAQHTIYCYRNSLQAIVFFRINMSYSFPQVSAEWTPLLDSENWILHGDEVIVKCSEYSDPMLAPRCQALIRYGRYISRFGAPIGDGLMNLDEFRDLVIEIDDRMTASRE